MEENIRPGSKSEEDTVRKSQSSHAIKKQPDRTSIINSKEAPIQKSEKIFSTNKRE